MGRRGREKAKQSALTAPVTEYRDAEGNVLALRGAMSPATRRAYADILAGGLHREDARARAIEMLFERLAVSWTISEIETSHQKQLLARYRMATAAERDFVLATLRTHLAENFPELEAP
ncbi:MAG: hypothetical protein ACXVUX_21575 [Solirubrobacteraceae bacterium]